MDVSSQSALAAGAVMGIMIIPFISSLSDDVITAVPRSLRDGALGLGSTRGEMITKVVLPAAFPGLVGAFSAGYQPRNRGNNDCCYGGRGERTVNSKSAG